MPLSLIHVLNHPIGLSSYSFLLPAGHLLSWVVSLLSASPCSPSTQPTYPPSSFRTSNFSAILPNKPDYLKIASSLEPSFLLSLLSHLSRLDDICEVVNRGPTIDLEWKQRSKPTEASFPIPFTKGTTGGLWLPKIWSQPVTPHIESSDLTIFPTIPHQAVFQSPELEE